MGDSHRGLAEAISRFFREWQQWVAGHLAEARECGVLRQDTDAGSLGRLIVSTVEGAILIHKASKDNEALLETMQALKSAINQYRA